MKTFNQWLIGVLITALAVFAYRVSPPFLDRLEMLFRDAHFQVRGPLSPGPEVVIAAIDEKSIDELGRWPWPRKTLAELTDKLVALQARVIGFNMVFSSPDKSSGVETLRELQLELEPLAESTPVLNETLDRYLMASDYDALLAQALARSGRSVLGYFFHFDPEGLDHLTEQVRHENFSNILPGQFKGFIKSQGAISLDLMEFRTAYAVEANVAALSQVSQQNGFISMDVESDGSIRKLPLVVRYYDPVKRQNYFFPPLAIRVLETYLEGTLLFRVDEFGVEKVLLDSADSVEIPTNEKGELEINFLGKRGTFPYLSVTDIIHDRISPATLELLRGKIVLVGATATGLQDIQVTPFDPLYPGVEIHATVIDNILNRNSLHQPEWIEASDSGYLIFLGLLLTWIYSRIKSVYGLVVAVGWAAAEFYLSQWVFEHRNIWVTNIYPQLENVLIFAALMIYRYNTEEKQKHYIQNVFTRYMSPGVIDQLLKDSGKLKLGGEQKELTAFFSDLEGFTAMSEALPAEEQVQFLNTYLTEMTDILLKYQGTLDKYDGDAIKAFFGAPLYLEDHARRACWVCVEMQDRLENLRRRWRKEGKPELHMRVGINTGQMVVGNIGSKNRMNYGMSGDSVNLAARLEGANKEYGTFSILSESTYQQAKEHIEVRELDSIRVRGRIAPVKIYELLGKRGHISKDILMLLPIYKKGIEHYKKREWKEAVVCFKSALILRPKDGPSATLLKRSIYFQKKPPPKKWDGVIGLSYK